MKKWQTLSSKVDYKNPYIKVRKDEVKTPGGLLADYYVLERSRFGVSIPVVENRFVMVRQYRYAIKQASLEFPMGGANPDENLKDCAQREMIEESGYDSDKLTYLGECAVAPGHSSQRFQAFLAENLVEVGHQNRDSLEADMEIELVKMTDFPKLVKKGEIIDGPTLAAYALYLIHIGNKD